MARTVFLTGFPGFIAGHLARRILADRDARLIFLVLPQMKGLAEREQAALGESASRTEIIVGDITRANLALEPSLLKRLRAEVNAVYHLAAIYDLATPERISRLVNVEGTENILDFCETLQRFDRLVYFSTAYVSGLHRGVWTEDNLEQTSSWKNYYEQTKWEAEVLVRKWWDKIPTVIIRPGVVVGDSKTGAINKYDGPYFIIRALCKLERAKMLWLGRWLMTKERGAPFYIVPVDYLADAVERLATLPNATGKAYHVLPSNPPTMDGLVGRLFEIFGIAPPPFQLSAGMLRMSTRIFPFFRLWLQFPIELFDYIRHNVAYPTTNLDAALAGSGLQCPSPEEYLPKMVAFVREHPEVAVNFGAHATSRPEKVTTGSH